MSLLRTSLLALASDAAAADTLKVFVLAGQSNMEGQAEVSSIDKTSGEQLNGTLAYQLKDPRTAARFARTWDEETQDWKVLSDVKIWFNEVGSQVGEDGSVIPGVNGVDAAWGSLTVGYGVKSDKNRIGPEFGFGHGMNAALGDQKILIVKTAWGGKTLAGDFRPPSSTKGADQYCQGDCDPSIVGHFYNVMLEDVGKLMKPGVLAQMFPDTAGLEPEIAGFGWFQGWNDGCNLNQTAAYETNMVNLIKDLRDEWQKPNLPVSIAVSGFDGFYGEEATRSPPNCWSSGNKINCNCAGDRGCRRLDVILSQFAAADPTLHPELGGHVAAMETRGFWREAQYSPNHGQGYHFWHNAETYYEVGQAMATGMLQMMGASPTLI